MLIGERLRKFQVRIANADEFQSSCSPDRVGVEFSDIASPDDGDTNWL